MRKWLLASSSMAAVLTAGVFLVPFLLAAKPEAKEKGQPDELARAAHLPIGQVMLYSSGVGFFQREGSVEGSYASGSGSRMSITSKCPMSEL